jgi:predicted nucleic acid-binding protein
VNIVIDTNIVLAVVLEEPERDRIVELSQGCGLVAPAVLPYEIGNALTAMMKKAIIAGDELPAVWNAIQKIPVDLRAVDISAALQIAAGFGIYAYDAYFLECAASLRAPVLTLDRGMQRVARQLDLQVLE